jgi:hypothetical protein
MSFQYELSRSMSALAKQKDMLTDVSFDASAMSFTGNRLSLTEDNDPTHVAATIVSVAEHYQRLVAEAGQSNAEGAMAVVARHIEREGVYGVPSPDAVRDAP